MPRTTVDLDAPILRELKRLQAREGQSLGRVISELVAEALAFRKVPGADAPALAWIARPMAPRFDLADKDSILDAMDQAPGTPGR